MHKSFSLPMLLITVLFIVGCGESYVPKPEGYFRIDLPKKNYTQKNPENCPFSFEMHSNSQIEYVESEEELCWFNISYPKQRARLHFTYKPIDDNLRQLIEETHQLTFEHQIMANRIEPTQVILDSTEVYGLIYDLGGNVASPLQFYVTDSTNHFLRASLYFMSPPNADSIQPVLNYIHKDVEHLVETLHWQ